ncbi:MAG: Uma2 family endonuclease [Gemmataceae bacterium]
MTAVPKTKLTVAEYLAIEKQADFKSEFYAGEMFAMAGASREHNRVSENLSIEIGSRLKGGPCQSFSRDLRVRVQGTGLYCYPDLVIVCGEPEFAEEDNDTLTNPRVVFEVLSPSTERYDRTTKFLHYQRLPSVLEYVLVAPDRAWCERYVRQPDGAWSLVQFVGLDATLELKSVPVVVPLADVYARVEFPPPEPRPAA